MSKVTKVKASSNWFLQQVSPRTKKGVRVKAQLVDALDQKNESIDKTLTNDDGEEYAAFQVESTGIWGMNPESLMELQQEYSEVIESNL